MDDDNEAVGGSQDITWIPLPYCTPCEQRSYTIYHPPSLWK